MKQQQVPVTGWYLENKLPGHFKFYLVLVSDNGVVTTSWGKIGTAGQHKVQKLSTAADARDIGLRQVFTKKSKGYSAVTEDLTFMVEEQHLEAACQSGDASTLNNKFAVAMKDTPADGGKEAVFQHYATFAEQAQRLLDKAGTQGAPLDELFTELEQIRDAFNELEEKHNQAKIALGLAEKSLAQALMGSA